MLQQRGWKLILDVDQFVEEVLTVFEHLESDGYDAEVVRKLIVREATRRYSTVLYESARSDGTRKQQQAFQELWDYLFPFALYKTGDRYLMSMIVVSLAITFASQRFRVYLIFPFALACVKAIDYLDKRWTSIFLYRSVNLFI